MKERAEVAAVSAHLEYGGLVLAVLEGARLEARRDAGGWRHHLDGHPVRCGAALDLLTSAGWMRVRYEATLAGTLPGPRATLDFVFPTGELESQPVEEDGTQHWYEPRPWETHTVDHHGLMLFRWPLR